MNLFFWRKKKQEDDNNLVLRLHRGLQAANKENTGLHKRIRQLEGQIECLQDELCKMSIDRDDLYEKYTNLLKSLRKKGEPSD